MHRMSGKARMLARAAHCPAELQHKGEWSLADFVLVKKLGVGGASAVYKGFPRGSNTAVAVKMYFKSKMTSLNLHQVQREIMIHAQLDHPNVIALVRSWPCTVFSRILTVPPNVACLIARSCGRVPTRLFQQT